MEGLLEIFQKGSFWRGGCDGDGVYYWEIGFQGFCDGDDGCGYFNNFVFI